MPRRPRNWPGARTSATRLGVTPMPGFTGPKILWLRRHEPEVLDRTRHLLLPKDYLRLKLTGERITDVSDAAGTWFLDQARRDWSPEALAACGVDADWLPGLVESTAVAGRLRPEWASRWGLKPGIPVAGGGGDTAVGGVGIGAVDRGQRLRVARHLGPGVPRHAEARPDPDRMTHAFCHALPELWYSMAAMLNGASPLVSVARWTGRPDVATLLAEIEAAYVGPSPLLALPYLFGERTPHNDPDVRGALIGLTGSTSPADIGQAMLEAIAFSLRDGLDALVPSGPGPRVWASSAAARGRASGAASSPPCSASRWCATRAPNAALPSAPRDWPGSPSRARTRPPSRPRPASPTRSRPTPA